MPGGGADGRVPGQVHKTKVNSLQIKYVFGLAPNEFRHGNGPQLFRSYSFSGIFRAEPLAAGFPIA